jgi:hypothetical protein
MILTHGRVALEDFVIERINTGPHRAQPRKMLRKRISAPIRCAELWPLESFITHIKCTVQDDVAMFFGIQFPKKGNGPRSNLRFLSNHVRIVASDPCAFLCGKQVSVEIGE